MNRREFLGVVAAFPVLAGVEVEPQAAEAPKLQRFAVSIGPLESTTEYLQPGEARQFLLDATRDMATVLGQGKVYPVRPEPQWLTDAVDAALGDALARAREQERYYLRARLRSLDG